MTKVVLVLLVAVLVLFSGCAVLERTCGNGACNGWETAQSCPKDCKETMYKETPNEAGANGNA